MDYLDELDATAIQALAEMGVSLAITTTANVTTSTAEHSQHRVLRQTKIQASYLLRLEHPLPTSRDVANTLLLPRVPKTEIGVGESGTIPFCHLNQTGVDALDIWTASHYPKKKWTKVRLGIAHKENTLHMLGRDPTLPQNRPCGLFTPNKSNEVRGSSYPIEHFFYGTLASTTRLSRLFEIAASDVTALRPAKLQDGRTRLWSNKYRALVDSPGEQVEGFAYPVRSDEEENVLRRYEGDSYEVVAARFSVGGTDVYGRTFRFVGCEAELSG